MMVLADYEKEHLKRVRKCAAECTLFLKKDGSFPLEAPGKIAAYGAGVRGTIKGGTGSGEVNSRFSVNIEYGLKRAGFEITTESWLDGYDEVLKKARAEFIKRLAKEAKENHVNRIMYCMGKSMPAPEYTLPILGEGDTAIYVLSRDSGEGADRQPIKGDVKLSETEIRDILAINAAYKNFMLVLNVGGVVDLSPVTEVKNILVLSQLGVVTGYVLADILLGKANPSGKLTTSWAKWEDYSSLIEIGDLDETRYKEGIYVGYRYFDTVGKKPLYPFGFGQSYTEFAIDKRRAKIDGDQVTVTAVVKNTGNYAGKEVVQVYVSAPDGKLDKPYQELAGWAKTKTLAPGAAETVKITFSLRDLASYDTENACYVLETGCYMIRVGSSSADTELTALVVLDGTVVTVQTRNCLGKPDFEDYKPEAVAKEEIPEDIILLYVSAENLETIAVDTDPEYAIDARVKGLTNEELAYIGIGAFDPKAKGLDIIGSAATHVAGAAGESTSLFTDKGIKYMIMADGPAGLRLTKDYFVTEQGVKGLGTGMIPTSMIEFMGPIEKALISLVNKGAKPPKGAEILHQYCTAIPIGTALAQSFNFALCESLGDMVGDEMERCNVHLWLAPALNIHRSILCGRNFEYYSEDPLVSGMTAAAITCGVQKHETCGTTIKHYAANNQEANRYANNSQVSERAMREIYLKGFGICVKMSQPHALMTSYNLLNGTHTSEHRGLIEDILRCEYGYEGIVMTDWVIAMAADKKSVHRNALAAEVAKAGGDIFMPGGKGDYKNYLQALQDGSLTRKQAEINATRIVRMADKLVK